MFVSAIASINNGMFWKQVPQRSLVIEMKFIFVDKAGESPTNGIKAEIKLVSESTMFTHR